MESIRCRFCGFELGTAPTEHLWICPSCKRQNEVMSVARIEQERQRHYLCPRCGTIFKDQPFGLRFPCPSCGSYVRLRDYKILIPKRKKKPSRQRRKKSEDKLVEVTYSKIEERGDLGKDRYLREITQDQIHVTPRSRVITFVKGIGKNEEEAEKQSD